MAISLYWFSASGRRGRRSSRSVARATIEADDTQSCAERLINAIYAVHWKETSRAFAVTKLSNAVDLERSFGPIYAPGCLRQGRATFAIFGVNQSETQASIDAALTFGILWLDECRISSGHRTLIEGLKRVLPAGTSPLTRERLEHLHSGAAMCNCMNSTNGTTRWRKSTSATVAMSPPDWFAAQ